MDLRVSENDKKSLEASPKNVHYNLGKSFFNLVPNEGFEGEWFRIKENIIRSH